MTAAGSAYLNRRPRSLAEFRAQRRHPDSRLLEVHACIDRAETELEKISREYSDDRQVCADAALEILRDWRADYLKPLDDEMQWAREEGRG